MPTIKDVAARAGVSVGTVSNVLSGAATVTGGLKRRVERAIAELNYRPNHVARSLKKRTTRTLGMIISDIANPFFPELVRGAEDWAAERGYILTAFNTDDRLDRERQVFDLLRSRHVDGLLLVVALERDESAHVARALAEGLPIVCLDRRPVKLAVDSVTVDNVAGSQACVRHLIAEGHRRIATIAGGSNMYLAAERLEGYRRAMADAGLTVDPQWVREGDFRRESGYAHAHALLRLKRRPTAIFSGNFPMTLGAIEAMRELGLESPRDVALGTFDRLAMADVFRPRPTAVEQPSYAMGAAGTRLLIDRIEGRAPAAPQHVVLDTILRPGDSRV